MIKIASLPSPAASKSTAIKRPPIGSGGESSMAQGMSAGLGKFKPAPLTTKPNGLKTPIKLRPASKAGQTSITGTVTANQPIKVLPRPESSSTFKSIAKKTVTGGMAGISIGASASSSGMKKFKVSSIVSVSGGKSTTGTALSQRKNS